MFAGAQRAINRGFLLARRGPPIHRLAGNLLGGGPCERGVNPQMEQRYGWAQSGRSLRFAQRRRAGTGSADRVRHPGAGYSVEFMRASGIGFSEVTYQSTTAAGITPTCFWRSSIPFTWTMELRRVQ